VGAAQPVQVDFCINVERMGEIQEELAQPVPGEVADMADGWGPLVDQVQQHEDANVVEEQEQQQESFSLNQSGSTAHYRRAQGPVFAINMDDVTSSSTSSEVTSMLPEVQSKLTPSFRVMQGLAFDRFFGQQSVPLSFPTITSHNPISAPEAEEDEDLAKAIVP
jgi:hypothetical protein